MHRIRSGRGGGRGRPCASSGAAFRASGTRRSPRSRGSPRPPARCGTRAALRTRPAGGGARRQKGRLSAAAGAGRGRASRGRAGGRGRLGGRGRGCGMRCSAAARVELRPGVRGRGTGGALIPRPSAGAERLLSEPPAGRLPVLRPVAITIGPLQSSGSASQLALRSRCACVYSPSLALSYRTPAQLYRDRAWP